MNDIKRTQIPSLYDDLTPHTALKILHKNKNDYVSKKTLWGVAILSCCIGALSTSFIFWMLFISSAQWPTPILSKRNSAEQAIVTAALSGTQIHSAPPHSAKTNTAAQSLPAFDFN